MTPGVMTLDQIKQYRRRTDRGLLWVGGLGVLYAGGLYELFRLAGERAQSAVPAAIFLSGLTTMAAMAFWLWVRDETHYLEGQELGELADLMRRSAAAAEIMANRRQLGGEPIRRDLRLATRAAELDERQHQLDRLKGLA